MASNSSQLKTIWLIGAAGHPYHHALVILLPLSISLQVVVAIIMMVTGKIAMEVRAESNKGVQIGPLRTNGVQTTGASNDSYTHMSDAYLLWMYNMKKLIVIVILVVNLFISSFSFTK
jgi:hypothetical protein